MNEWETILKRKAERNEFFYYYFFFVKKREKMGLWRDIVLEGFCTYNWASKKNWKTFKYIGKGKISDKAITKKNDEYIPKSKRPTWCKKNNPKRLPQYSCLAGRKSEDKCPFFTYCNATKALYGWISFYYEKKSNR